MTWIEEAGRWTKTLFGKKRQEPSYPVLPASKESGECTVEGMYLLGEVAGTPLVKLGLNDGVRVVDDLHAKLGASSEDDEVLDFLIVGAGSSGLGAAMRAHELGRRYLVLEANRIAQTIVDMYKGKLLFAEPDNVQNHSAMWFEQCTREQLLEKWHAQIKEHDLNIKEHEKVTDIQKSQGHFVITSGRGTYKARHVLMAVGKAGNPRKAGVPGEKEHATRVFHSISDPSLVVDQKVFVYGGGDVACEAALALADQNDVTMVTIDERFIYPKKRNADAVLEAAEQGKLSLHFSSKLVSLGEGTVVFETGDGTQQTLENHMVLEMIGAVLPLAFFKRVGIKLEGTWDVKKWLVFALVFIGVYSLYALKKYPADVSSWPFNHLIESNNYDRVINDMFSVCFLPFRWLFTDEAYGEMLSNRGFQQGYLYSFAYTVLMIAFGWLAFVRWRGIARDPSYQKWRYASLIFFQVAFFVLVNAVAVQAFTLQHAWRAWGLYQPWPLFFNTFFWWYDGTPKYVVYTFVVGGLLGSFVAIPLASRWHGKRFCTWVCGCGGLAETLGDRWRHLSAKGERSRAWNFQGVVILAAAFIVTAVVIGAFDTRGDNAWWSAYDYIVDFWLVAVIPIALYPFFGGKVWCRYWCPLAAWNGLLAQWYGKLKIRSNDKCISCTMCSKYCQVGVDVMAFAKNQEYFDNANSNCIQCGICIDVCPMDVLYFDTSDDTVRVDAAVAAGE